MKVNPILVMFTCVVLAISCKQAEKKNAEPTPTALQEPTIVDQIAKAHGFENWGGVEKLAFTFNVDRGDNHYQRSWIWNTKTNEVRYQTHEDSLVYNRNSMDSIARQRNGGFINDKYWLLAPFNLVWDQDNFTYEVSDNVVAPISGEPMQKLTIVYGSEGGYTPGDAYDFFVGDDHIIREWIFRKANQEAPSMTTTWEAYKDTLGLKIATSHKTAEGDFHLYFDNLELKSK